MNKEIKEILEEERIKERRKIKECLNDTEKALKKANRRVKGE